VFEGVGRVVTWGILAESLTQPGTKMKYLNILMDNFVSNIII
jgi:hypothetical protein